jgi:hypothetical protein
MADDRGDGTSAPPPAAGAGSSGPGSGGAGSGGAGSAGRADRRRRKRRRSTIIAIAVGAVLVVAVGVVVLLVTRKDDTEAASTPRRTTASTEPSSTTTTSTLPVATTVVPRAANPVVALAQQYDGRYVGTFKNTTFSTTGPASLELRIDPATNKMAVDADFDGDLFGGGATTSRRISGSVALGDPNAAVTTQTKAFGPVTGQIDPSLAVVLTAAEVPDDKVKGFTLTGRLRSDNTGFDATYKVTFKDGTTADGTITLGCDPQGTRGSEVTTICALSQGG